MVRASLLVVAAWTAVCAAGPVGVKQVAAPPADMLSGVVVPPELEELGVLSRTALMPVRRHGGVPNAAGMILFHAHDARPVSVVMLSRQGWHAELSDERAGLLFSAESDRPAVQAGPEVSRSDARLPANLGDADATRLDLGARISGPMTLSITGDMAQGFVLIDPGADVTLYTHPTTLSRVVGQPYGLQPWLDNARIIRATADIRDPGGVMSTIEADADGVLGFTPEMLGVHAVRVEVTGETDAGLPITLTTQHVVHAAMPASLDGPVQTIEAEGLLTITLAGASQRTITAAEVWGLKDGVPTPVCWLARVCDGERTLALDLRWVALAGVDPSTLELRRVRSHDTESYSMVGDLERATLPPLRGPLPVAPIAPTPDMLTGRPGVMTVESSLLDGASPRSVLPGHRLFLIHGYCSGGNPFPLADFPGAAAVFADPNQNRTHDAFAQTILAQGAPMKSYGVVAHSQGGMAALHLSTFYWSGLDWSQGERLIQSVGTPYQGTPLAGDAAVLGSIFGSGCGSNADLDPAGAAAWLSLIPSASRANVWYWSTSFTDRPFQIDFCNFVSGLLLSDPEDGVVERSRAQLPGANNMGHTQGWCHTAGMRDPAQTTDAARNAQMNERARR
jgi:hypothetical protein